MKNINFFLVVFILSAIVRGQGVSLKIYNRTGCALDSVVMGSIIIGHIPKDSIKVITHLNELVMLGDVPLRRPSGIADGRKTKTFLAECATKSKKINSGTYPVDLLLKEDAGILRLEWRPHQTEKTKQGR